MVLCNVLPLGRIVGTLRNAPEFPRRNASRAQDGHCRLASRLCRFQCCGLPSDIFFFEEILLSATFIIDSNAVAFTEILAR